MYNDLWYNTINLLRVSAVKLIKWVIVMLFHTTGLTHQLTLLQTSWMRFLRKYIHFFVSWRYSGTFYLWPCITKPTKSRMAQFCVMARNRWSGSAWVIFRFWYILKEESFFYIILKFGSIKRIISRVVCCFSRPIFVWSDGIVAIIALVLSFPYELDYLAYFEPL